ncbi:hypothetical protein Pmani_011656 [Petrolisthes manimaculis]|uniref:Uncharacterized protein n=1 Tax=Petrolisthes manimaculis TaxID=1843537 RepID=A0AAE1UE90_9EUCA|nr:hypothetical protein Pmani_011656 [Petrolisthes manimaculis]
MTKSCTFYATSRRRGGKKRLREEGKMQTEEEKSKREEEKTTSGHPQCSIRHSWNTQPDVHCHYIQEAEKAGEHTHNLRNITRVSSLQLLPPSTSASIVGAATAQARALPMKRPATTVGVRVTGPKRRSAKPEKPNADPAGRLVTMTSVVGQGAARIQPLTLINARTP